jgi:hypothetical protein
MRKRSTASRYLRTQMPAICTLLCEGRSLRGTIGVRSSTIATHDLDFLVLLQPVPNRGCLAIRQHIDDVVCIKIDDDGSIRFATFPREIIDADMGHLLNRWE